MIIVVMLLGAAVVYMVLRRIYSRLWYKNLTLEIAFSKKHVICGESVQLIEVVTNKKRLPLPYINVKFQVNRALKFEDGEENSVVSDMTYRNDVFSLMMYQRVTRNIPVKCGRRGVYSLERADMTSSGLFMNDINLIGTKQHAHITVFPRSADTQKLSVLYSKVTGAVEKNKYLNPDIFAFRGIRDYDTSDTMNTINWKASAGNGQLMVNQYQETMCQSVCILLNLEPEGMLKDEVLLEESISIASGLAQNLIEQRVQVSLVSNGVDYIENDSVCVDEGMGQAHLNAVNTALARIDLSKQPKSFADMLLDLKRGAGAAKNRALSEKQDVLFVMISQSRRRDVQLAFDSLTGKNSMCVWILPFYREQETALDYTCASLVEWEVHKRAV